MKTGVSGVPGKNSLPGSTATVLVVPNMTPAWDPFGSGWDWTGTGQVGICLECVGFTARASKKG